jgi:hypothetical protein
MPPQLNIKLYTVQVSDGLSECKPASIKGHFNWGSSELKEATLVNMATNTTPNIIQVSTTTPQHPLNGTVAYDLGIFLSL